MIQTLIKYCLILVTVLTMFACKSEFEKVRTSGNPDQILEKANEYYEQEKYARAQTLYELVVNALRGDPRLQDAYLKYAHTFFYTEQYILSSLYFKNYAETYTVSEDKQTALYMEALSYLKLSPNYRLDQEYTTKAILAFEQFINIFPDTDKMDEINDLMAKLRVKQETKSFQAAQLYYDMSQYQSGVRAFERVLQDYPDSDRAEEIRYKIALSHIKLADNSVLSKRRQRYNEALDDISLYTKKYPKGKYLRSLREESNRIKKLLKKNENYVRY